MAVTQISRIQQRRGLQQDLPQLASAELGWSLDTRQLYIGNGTTAEGAPTAGVTEILTQYSDFFSSVNSYTYKDTATGYTVQTGLSALNPIARTLQSKLDDFVTTRDFGTIGNGVVDDTLALQRAITQIYLASLNTTVPMVRRVIHIPAGTYLISSTLLIPPYCTLEGEGKNNTIIVQSANVPAAITCDSRFQFGSLMGIASALLPSSISIRDLSFQQKINDNDVFVVDSATNMRFAEVSFVGASVWTANSVSAGVRVLATVGNTQQVILDNCAITGVSTAANLFTTGTYNIQSVTFDNSFVTKVRAGITANTISTGSPSSINIVNSRFDNVVSSAIVSSSTAYGVTSVGNKYNNVANGTGTSYGSDSTPTAPVLVFGSSDSSSISDVFSRSDSSGLIYPSVANAGTSYVVIPHVGVQSGLLQQSAGTRITLADNQSTYANIVTLTSPFTGTITRGIIDYAIDRGTTGKFGQIEFFINNGEISYTEDYSSTVDPGVSLQIVANAVQYTSTMTGTNPTFTYTIKWLS